MRAGRRQVCQALLSFVLFVLMCVSVRKLKCSGTLRIRNISSLIVTSDCNTKRMVVCRSLPLRSIYGFPSVFDLTKI